MPIIRQKPPVEPSTRSVCSDKFTQIKATDGKWCPFFLSGPSGLLRCTTFGKFWPLLNLEWTFKVWVDLYALESREILQFGAMSCEKSTFCSEGNRLIPGFSHTSFSVWCLISIYTPHRHCSGDCFMLQCDHVILVLQNVMTWCENSQIQVDFWGSFIGQRASYLHFTHIYTLFLLT